MLTDPGTVVIVRVITDTTLLLAAAISVELYGVPVPVSNLYGVFLQVIAVTTIMATIMSDFWKLGMQSKSSIDAQQRQRVACGVLWRCGIQLRFHTDAPAIPTSAPAAAL